jgi:hypothetical protein
MPPISKRVCAPGQQVPRLPGLAKQAAKKGVITSCECVPIGCRLALVSFQRRAHHQQSTVRIRGCCRPRGQALDRISRLWQVTLYATTLHRAAMVALSGSQDLVAGFLLRQRLQL